MRLIAKVFRHVNFAGEYRYIHNDVFNVSSQLGFNDKVSSIIVYRGSDYVQGDKIRFHEHINYGGGYIELEPGYYPNIHVHPFSFGDKISSVNFLPFVFSSILPVRLDIKVYEHINFGGQMREILVSENNLHQQSFNDKISSIRIFAGPDYQSGFVANFHQHINFSGGILAPGNFGPGTNISNIAAAPFSFNDTISSISIFNQYSIRDLELLNINEPALISKVETQKASAKKGQLN